MFHSASVPPVNPDTEPPMVTYSLSPSQFWLDPQPASASEMPRIASRGNEARPDVTVRMMFIACLS